MALLGELFDAAMEPRRDHRRCSSTWSDHCRRIFRWNNDVRWRCSDIDDLGRGSG